MYNPPAPQTLAALRGLAAGGSGGGGPGDGGGTVLRFDAAGSDSSSALPSAGLLFGHQLLFTVHYGVGFTSLFGGSDEERTAKQFGIGGYQLQVRYGNAGGMTTPAFTGGDSSGRGGDVVSGGGGAQDVAVWNQRFSLPLQDMQSPIELFLIDTEAAARNTDPKDGAYLIGGVMLAPPDVQWNASDGSIATEQTWRAYRGDHVRLAVTTFERRRGGEGGSSSHAAIIAHNESVRSSMGHSSASHLEDRELEDLSLCVSWEVVLASQLQNHLNDGHHGDDDDDVAEEADPLAPVPIQRNGEVKPAGVLTSRLGGGGGGGSDRGSSIPVSNGGNSSVAAAGQQQLQSYDVDITFEIDRIDQYPATSLVSNKQKSSSVLFCMARRSDGDCSDYVALRQRHNDNAAQDGSSAYGLHRFDQVEDTGRTCTMICRIPYPSSSSGGDDDDESQRVIQLLVCESEEEVHNNAPRDNGDDSDDDDAQQEGAALRVVASTSLLFTALAPRGSATFVLDSLDDDNNEENRQQQRPYGELCVNWQVTPVLDEQTSWAQAQRLLFPATSSSGGGGEEYSEGARAATCGNDLTPQSIDSDVLCVTVVRGIDLRRAPLGGEQRTNHSHTSEHAARHKLSRPLVAVAVGPLLASTPIATIPESQLLLHPRAPCNVIWDQELIFPFPTTNLPRRTLVELILQQDHEIVSIGALSLQDALERSKILTNVRGGVVEGFEVVPLLQEGHIGALGHILARWRYIAHDQLALQQRQQGRSKSTETPDPYVDGEEDQHSSSHLPHNNNDNSTPVKQRLASSSPRATDVLSALRSSPPPGAQPSPRRVSTSSPQLHPTAVTPNTSFAADGGSQRRQSPGSSITSSPPVVHLSRRRLSVDAITSPIQSFEHDDGHGEVVAGGRTSAQSALHEHEAPHNEAIMSNGEFSAQRRRVSSHDNASHEDQRHVELTENDEAEDERLPSQDPRMDSYHVRGDVVHSDDDDDNDNHAPAPEPRPKLVFRVRTGQDGRPQVAFYDPSTTTSTSATPTHLETETKHQQGDADYVEGGIVPPVNGPYHFSSEGLQWSSHLHRVARTTGDTDDAIEDADIVKDPAQLLREELEIRNRMGGMRQHHLNRSALGKPFPAQPWYPPGESKDESHVPVSRRESQRKQLDAIVELTMKSRFVAHQSAARENRGNMGAMSTAVSHDVSRSTSVQQNIVSGLRPHGMHFAN
ncbi:Hypothetical protein, putative [Bodo saltans]|uniref:Uncharacterized protein n=1 Tax=Bodo saltans TaxID=75058 RepID=A0A0S4IMF1_BODSA|nr:Hypothetical protein, putative [Bodo saltans]|eukprot:CUF44180.1 Hypothetical protein, putative [Bodo saltans]